MDARRETIRPVAAVRSLFRAVIAALVSLVLAVGTLGAQGTAAGPALVVTPNSGPCGSRVVIHGEGFQTGRPIDLFARRVAPTPAQGSQIAEASVNPSGAFTVELALLGCDHDPEGAQIAIIAMSRTVNPRETSVELARASYTLGTAPRCFAETGFCVRGRFLTHWTTQGGLAINGYPISDEFRQQLEDGRTYTVQYFERSRLEYHPENAYPYEVLLGQFGRRFHPADPPVARQAGGLYFAETGHNLRGRFAACWEANGGLAQFGYPLTEEFTERLGDGKTYTVQYFERARFEYHPENKPPYDVLLGQFGRRIFAETSGR